MTYQLHITRASDWMHSEELPITAPEWLKLVRTDSELIQDHTHGTHFVRWAGSVGRDRWLEWAEGRINTNYPDGALLKKLVAIAERLGAKVQGDGGEVYSGEEPVDEWAEYDELPYTPRQILLTQRLPWWRRVLRRRVAR
ncbi:MAG: hypothetical protein M3303_03315 [Gemmatimonadota bacterium]|nr:hypothetical protein [Gemmatimonadota bacterium]